MSALISIYDIKDATAVLGGSRGFRNGTILLKTSNGDIQLCTWSGRNDDEAVAALQDIVDHITRAVDQLRADVEGIGKLVDEDQGKDREVADALAKDVRESDKSGAVHPVFQGTIDAIIGWSIC